jgi:hypothetical protein
MIALLLLLLLAFSSFSHLSLFVPCYGTFCAFPWHLSLKSLFVLCYGTFCAFPWHISLESLFVAHKFKSLFVPSCGTFCPFPWNILCLPVAHGILFPLVKNCKSGIASQELQVKNCKKSILDSLDIFFSWLNE